MRIARGKELDQPQPKPENPSNPCFCCSIHIQRYNFSQLWLPREILPELALSVLDLAAGQHWESTLFLELTLEEWVADP